MIKTLTNRWTTAFALGAISLASLAPMAQAGHGQGGGNRFRGAEGGGRGFQGVAWRGHDAWRGGGHFDRGFRGGRVIVRQHSSIGPAFAGLVGGLVLGSALSHAAPVREHVVYRDRVVYDDGGGYAGPDDSRDVFYVDPSCGERFDSFGACSDYLSYEHHPRVIDVVDSRSGNVVQRFAYDNGAWREIPFDDDDN
jgi:hypothetical protein